MRSSIEEMIKKRATLLEIAPFLFLSIVSLDNLPKQVLHAKHENTRRNWIPLEGKIESERSLLIILLKDEVEMQDRRV